MAQPPGTGPAAGHPGAGGLRVAHVRPLRLHAAQAVDLWRRGSPWRTLRAQGPPAGGGEPARLSRTFYRQADSRLGASTLRTHGFAATGTFFRSANFELDTHSFEQGFFLAQFLPGKRMLLQPLVGKLKLQRLAVRLNPEFRQPFQLLHILEQAGQAQQADLA